MIQAAFCLCPIVHWTESYIRFSRHFVKSFKVILKRGRLATTMTLHTFILRQPCWWARERLQPILPYNIMENSPTSFARNSVLIGANDFKFGTEKFLWSYRPYQNLGQIDHNLHNHVFDDVICKPPIEGDRWKSHLCLIIRLQGKLDLFRACISSGKLGICRVSRPVSRERLILINSWKWRRVSQLFLNDVVYLLLIF